jgi:DNA-binding response OmpR family regulator
MARILIADDELPIRQLVRMACERAGHEVIEAINAPTAVEAYERLKPDLLILDVGMPGGGGPFVLNSLRFGGARKIGPVLVITGSVAGSADEIRQSLSVDGALTKPFRIPELLAAVRNLLAKATPLPPPPSAPPSTPTPTPEPGA